MRDKRFFRRIRSRPRVRYFAAFLAVLGTMIGVSTATPMVYAAVTSTKTGTDASTGKTDVIQAGNKINWVLNYGHTGERGTVEVRDTLPKESKYVQGSLVAPPGFSVSFSSDNGGTFASTDFAENTTTLKATGQAPPTSTAVADGIAPPPREFSTPSGAGDGMQALFFDNRLYNVNHHRGASAAGPYYRPMIQCHDKFTGEICPGYPAYPSAVAGTPLKQAAADSTNADDTLITPNQAWDGVNQAKKRAFIPTGVYQSKSIGVLCLDFSTPTATSCGYTKLADAATPNQNGTDGGGTSEISGGAQIGNKYFLIDDQAVVHCFDTDANAVCSDWPTLDLKPTSTDPVLNPPLSIARSNLQAYDNRYIIGMAQSTANSSVAGSIICIDTTQPASGNRLCPNFPKKASPTNGVVLPTMSASGALTGVCAVNFASGGPAVLPVPWLCYKLSDGTTFTAPWAGSQPANSTVAALSYGSGTAIGTKLYIPYNEVSTGKATYVCWDFAIGTSGSPCSGFTSVKSGDNSAPYSLRVDPYNPGCIWEVGDTGHFEVFDAKTGGLDCHLSFTQVAATPEQFYCDGKPNHVRSWKRALVGGIDAADFTGGVFTLHDKNGTVVPGFDNKVYTSAQLLAGIDLSGVPITGNTSSLHIDLQLSGTKDAAWENGAPYTQLEWEGDNIQICYQTTTPPCTPALQSLTNQAIFTTKDPTTSDSPADATIKLVGNGCNNPQNETRNKVSDPTGRLAETGDSIPPIVALALVLILMSALGARRYLH